LVDVRVGDLGRFLAVILIVAVDLPGYRQVGLDLERAQRRGAVTVEQQAVDEEAEAVVVAGDANSRGGLPEVAPATGEHG
jgi:hypothetical protein